MLVRKPNSKLPVHTESRCEQGSVNTSKVHTQEQVLENEFISYKIKEVDLDDVDERDKFSANDYRLENILSAGATDLLRPTATLNGNRFDSIHNIEATAELLSQIPMGEKENNENKTEEE